MSNDEVTAAAVRECRVRLSEDLLRRLHAAGWAPDGSAVDREIVNWMLDHGTNPDGDGQVPDQVALFTPPTPPFRWQTPTPLVWRQVPDPPV
jgi:hypothetical protein